MNEKTWIIVGLVVIVLILIIGLMWKKEKYITNGDECSINGFINTTNGLAKTIKLINPSQSNLSSIDIVVSSYINNNSSLLEQYGVAARQSCQSLSAKVSKLETEIFNTNNSPYTYIANAFPTDGNSQSIAQNLFFVYFAVLPYIGNLETVQAQTNYQTLKNFPNVLERIIQILKGV